MVNHVRRNSYWTTLLEKGLTEKIEAQLFDLPEDIKKVIVVLAKEAVEVWLQELRNQEQITYDYLEPKAKNDLIHRSMWLSQGAVLAFIDQMLFVLQTFGGATSEEEGSVKT